MRGVDREAQVGLCLGCRHARVVRSRTNQDYYRCGRFDDDERYAKYPRLPMRKCDGYEPHMPDRLDERSV